MATSTETTIFITNLVTGNQSSGNETTTTTTTNAVETTYLPADDVTDDDVSTEVKAASASVLTILCIASFALNILTLLVLVKATQWKKSANYLLVNVTVADLLMTLLWGVPAIVSAASWEWNLGGEFCTFHEFIGTWCHVVVVHSLVTVGVEKFVLFWKPSKHKEVFYRTVVLVLITGIWIFDLVIALFPLMGWGEVWYSPYQFQCVEDYKISYSLLNFNFVVIYLIPTVAIVVLYSLAIHKIRVIRKKSGPSRNGKFIIEEDRNVPHETFGQKYAKQQRKYKALGKPKKRSLTSSVMKEKERKEMAKDKNKGNFEEKDDGYESNSKIEDDSSEYEGPEDYETLNEKKKALDRKRVYLFKEQEFMFALTIFAATMVYLACWFPILAVSYYWAYNFESPPSDAVVAALAGLTFLGLSVKPIVYLTCRQARISVRQAIQKYSDKKSDKVENKSNKDDIKTGENKINHLETSTKQDYAVDMTTE